MIPTPYDHSTQDFIGQQLIGSFVGAIDRKLVPTGEQAVGFFVGGGGRYVRDWKIVLPGDPWSLRTTKEVARAPGRGPRLPHGVALSGLGPEPEPAYFKGSVQTYRLDKVLTWLAQRHGVDYDVEHAWADALWQLIHPMPGAVPELVAK